MSLCVWLPLDSNLDNKGVSTVILTNGTPVYKSAGKIGTCLDLSSKIALNCSELANLTTFSICLWAKVNTDTTLSTNWVDIISFTDATSDNSTGLLRWETCYASANSSRGPSWHDSATYATTPATTLSGTQGVGAKDEWEHLTITVGDDFRVYRQGILECVCAVAGGHLTGAFTIGENNLINGEINDVRIYDHCLSAAEVHEIAQGLVLHYKLDGLMSEVDTGIVEDSSGYGHNGEILNSITTLTDTPRYQQCVHISDTNQKIKISNFPTAGFGNSYSFVWWAKVSSASPMHWGFADGIRLNGMYTGTLWNTGDGSSNPLYEPGTTTQVSAPTTGIWHHYAMVGDGSTCKVYLDGVFWAQAKTYKAISGTTIFINGWDTSTSYSSNDLSISDFRIYCAPLLDTDIKLLYNVGMRVDNLGGIHSFEFNETTNEKLLKTGVLQSNELEETSIQLAKLKNNKGWLSPEFIEI